MAFAFTSDSCVHSSMQAAQRQAKRKSRASYALSWASLHTIATLPSSAFMRFGTGFVTSELIFQPGRRIDGNALNVNLPMDMRRRAESRGSHIANALAFAHTLA